MNHHCSYKICSPLSKQGRFRWSVPLEMESDQKECPVAGASQESVSECDVDSICGMLMQLQMEMKGKTDGPDSESSSCLWITKEDKAEMAIEGTLASIIFSDKETHEKEAAIKRMLDAEDIVGGDLVNGQDGRGRTCLMYAVAEASAPVIQLLLQCKSIDYLIRDRSGNTVLMYASVRGYDSIIRLLMNQFKRKYPKDSAILLDLLDAENDEGNTAFTLALKNGHEDCAIVLSEYLKEALEREERRVTSLAYRMGLRGRTETRMATSEPDTTKAEFGDFKKAISSAGSSPGRHRSASPKKRTSERLAMLSFRGHSLIGRGGRDVSRYYADEEDGLLDSEETESPTKSPELQKVSGDSQAQGNVGIKINLDLKVDHHHYFHHSSKMTRVKGRKHEPRKEKQPSEEKRPLHKN